MLDRLFLALLSLLVSAAPLPAEEKALIAVAANFQQPMEALAADFQQQTSATLQFTFGSSGRLYAQISNGAPYHAFLSADEERPALLEKQGDAVAGTRFTYAIGRLALWSPSTDVGSPDATMLRSAQLQRLAIAKPDLSPYGAAARQTLQRLNLWDTLQDRLTYGESISQTFHFVHTGNAELGLVAWAQLHALPEATRGSWWIVPEELHAPIRQDAVLLQDNSTARSFLQFLGSKEARETIQALGYGVGTGPLPAEH